MEGYPMTEYERRSLARVYATRAAAQHEADYLRGLMTGRTYMIGQSEKGWIIIVVERQ